jgi:hypothetical protein
MAQVGFPASGIDRCQHYITSALPKLVFAAAFSVSGGGGKPIWTTHEETVFSDYFWRNSPQLYAVAGESAEARYMRVYHFLSMKYGKQDLLRRRLKLASAADLNDPFDFIAFGSTERGVRQLVEMNRTLFSTYWGLLCFSKNWANPVQWTHYADGHRGICLGFDVPDGLLNSVRYAQRRPMLRSTFSDGNKPMSKAELIKLLTTKYVHWRYEQEIRELVPLTWAKEESGRYFLAFSNTLTLKEVIVGARCTMSRSDVQGVLRKARLSADIKKARLSFRSFRVVRQRCDALCA